MIEQAIEQLIIDLADSPGVRELLKVGSVRDALKRIHLDGLPEPTIGADEQNSNQMRDLRPYCLVYSSESDSCRIRSIASPSCYEMTGSIEVLFSQEYPEHKTPTEAWREIVSKISSVVRSEDPNSPGLLNYLGSAGRLQIQEIIIDMIGRTPFEHRTEYGDAYDVLLTIRY
jgi:hypothetical protein